MFCGVWVAVTARGGWLGEYGMSCVYLRAEFMVMVRLGDFVL